MFLSRGLSKRPDLMKRFVSSALAVVLALNLCSCRIYGKKQESTEETPRTAPQGEAFSLDGMTADEMMELFESLAVVHNGDDPASYASSFPVPYYPDDSLPDHGEFGFYANDNVHSYIEGISYPTDWVSEDDHTQVIDYSDFYFFEIYLCIDDKDLALEMYDRLAEKIRSWNGTYKSDYIDESRAVKYYSVTYEELGWEDDNITFYVMYSVPEHGYYYHITVRYPIMIDKV